MGSLEIFIRSKYNMDDDNAKREIYNILDSVDSEEKVYKAFECKYNKTNRNFLYNLANIVGYDLSIYKERRKKIIKYCKKCGKPLCKSQKLFCSKSCAAKYNNTKRGKKTEEQKQRISQTLREGYKNKKYKNIKIKYRQGFVLYVKNLLYIEKAKIREKYVPMNVVKNTLRIEVII